MVTPNPNSATSHGIRATRARCQAKNKSSSQVYGLLKQKTRARESHQCKREKNNKHLALELAGKFVMRVNIYFYVTLTLK